MSQPAPPLDTRSAPEIERQLIALMRSLPPTGYKLDGWSEFDPASGFATGFSGALTGVFARYAELIIQRLNQVLDKNQLAFLDLLGAALQPPQPAEVPLSFALTAGALQARVPAGTQVAVPAGPGQALPIVFETARELMLTPAKLARIISWDASNDRWGDYSAAASPQGVDGKQLFCGDAPVHLQRGFFLSLDPLFSYGSIGSCELVFTIDLAGGAALDSRTLQINMWDGLQGLPAALQSSSDGTNTYSGDYTNNLTVSGMIGFADSLLAGPALTIAGVNRRWMSFRLQQGVTDNALSGCVRASQVPTVKSIRAGGIGMMGPLPPDGSFNNTLPVDTSRDFYPFGESPKVGDAWYLGNNAIFSRGNRPGESITLNLWSSQVSSPSGATSPSPAPTLQWEYWNGSGWRSIGTSVYGGAASAANGCQFYDYSRGFSAGGNVVFSFDQPPQPTTVNGQSNYWVRVRIIGGSRSFPFGYVGTPQGTMATAPALSLNGLSCTYAVDNAVSGHPFTPDAIVLRDGYDDMLVSPDSAFRAFPVAPDRGRSVYLGFTLPAALSSFPQQTVSLYLELAEIPYGRVTPDNSTAAIPPRLGWYYWNGSAWDALLVNDGTACLTRSGLIEFLPPADFATRSLFQSDGCWWLRVSWESGDYKFLPRLRRALLNTVPALQLSSISGAVLGSSTGETSQAFQFARTPVLAGPAVEVLEPELPPAAERAALLAEEGADAIAVVAGTPGAWVRWHEVTDFYASGPRDRHYVLDHTSGGLRFGDGQHGLIPPAGASNIRAARYQIGGGSAGNVDAGQVTQLRSVLPYVDSVTNWIAASGGVEAEDTASLLERAPREVRHRERAVTVEDYQDLARLASPEVARCLAVPLRDLSVDPAGTVPRPGVVSLIVVPNAPTAKPVPSMELIGRVSDFLAGHQLPVVEEVVVGPEYVDVSVSAQIAVAQLEGAGDIGQAARGALDAFLHPLSGGFDGRGWNFGRTPHVSDLYRVLEAVPGVDYVRSLTVALSDDQRPGAGATGRFLVASGMHRLDLVYGP